MGTHPIFESDFDCLTEKDSSLHKRGMGCALVTVELVSSLPSRVMQRRII